MKRKTPTKALHTLFIEAARKLPQDHRVPVSFEKRIMARIDADSISTDTLALWAKGLWQAAIPCLALMFFIGTWNALDHPEDSQVDPLAADLDLAMLQPFDELSLEELW